VGETKLWPITPNLIALEVVIVAVMRKMITALDNRNCRSPVDRSSTRLQRRRPMTPTKTIAASVCRCVESEPGLQRVARERQRAYRLNHKQLACLIRFHVNDHGTGYTGRSAHNTTRGRLGSRLLSASTGFNERGPIQHFADKTPPKGNDTEH
jgi:hypothetical protein